jgi:hypothetical protein
MKEIPVACNIKKIEILIEGSQGPGIFLSYIRIKIEPPD